MWIWTSVQTLGSFKRGSHRDCRFYRFEINVHVLCPGVTLTLPDSATVEEDAGFVMVCVTLSGTLERDVVVTLDTEDGTALGENVESVFETCLSVKVFSLS